MKVLLVPLLSLVVGSTVVLGAAPPSKPATAKEVRSPTLGLALHVNPIRSCAKELTVKVQIDDSVLHSAYSATYNSVNFDEVKVDVYHSFISGNDVMCQYRSAHKDIPNLVYRMPCPGATLANNGYAHAYRCTN
jgi:hypothetical protein